MELLFSNAMSEMTKFDLHSSLTILHCHLLGMAKISRGIIKKKKKKKVGTGVLEGTLKII